MSRKEKNVNTLKWLLVLIGIGEVVFGVLNYLWDGGILSSGYFALEGLVKLGVGWVLPQMVGKEPIPHHEEDWTK